MRLARPVMFPSETSLAPTGPREVNLQAGGSGASTQIGCTRWVDQSHDALAVVRAIRWVHGSLMEVTGGDVI